MMNAEKQNPHTKLMFGFNHRLLIHSKYKFCYLHTIWKGFVLKNEFRGIPIIIKQENHDSLI